MILVLGATGKVGAETVKCLKAKGIQATAASRDPNRAQAQLGVPAVMWDFEQPAQCAQALQGIESVLVLTPPGLANELEYGLRTVGLAKAAGVRKIVKVSSIGTETQPQSTHRRVELAIEQAGFQWTFLRPSFYMQNCNTIFLHGIKQDGGIFLPAGEGRTGFVDARDVGAVAAEALCNDGLVGRGLTLTGSEPLTYAEAASILGRAIGRTVRYIEITPERFKEALLSIGVADWYCDFMNVLYAHVSAGHLATVTDDVAQVLRRPPTSFEAYARDYAAVFN